MTSQLVWNQSESAGHKHWDLGGVWCPGVKLYDWTICTSSGSPVQPDDTDSSEHWRIQYFIRKDTRTVWPHVSHTVEHLLTSRWLYVTTLCSVNILSTHHRSWTLSVLYTWITSTLYSYSKYKRNTSPKNTNTTVHTKIIFMQILDTIICIESDPESVQTSVLLLMI